MRRVLLLVAILAAMVLGWGYWHVTSHATIHVSIYDVSLKNDKQAYGRALSADVALLDAAGTVLARGRATEPLGTVSIFHPEVGDCTGYEREAPFADRARMAWQRCFETSSRWLITWAKDVRYATVTLRNCRIDRTPVVLREYRDDWWMWWVPLPHIGGPPYTHFDLSLKVDGIHCRAVDS